MESDNAREMCRNEVCRTIAPRIGDHTKKVAEEIMVKVGNCVERFVNMIYDERQMSKKYIEAMRKVPKDDVAKDGIANKGLSSCPSVGRNCNGPNSTEHGGWPHRQSSGNIRPRNYCAWICGVRAHSHGGKDRRLPYVVVRSQAGLY